MDRMARAKIPLLGPCSSAPGGDEALDTLLPFKYRNRETAQKSSVEGAEDIKHVLVFDENYVAQFAFQQDEVLKNSFEVFIKTPEYDEGIEDLDRIFKQVKQFFLENDALDKFILAFSELRDAFTLTKAGGIAKTSKGVRALRVGGKLSKVPPALAGFKSFLQSTDPAGWIAWQSKGKPYLDLSEHCPFCGFDKFDKEAAALVSAEYESAAVKSMASLRETIDRLSAAFEPSALTKLRAITQVLGNLSPEQEGFLADLRNQVGILLEKFTALKALSFDSLRSAPDVESCLDQLRIDLTLLSAFQSPDTQTITDGINAELDDLRRQVGQIKGQINKQNRRVAETISRNQRDINNFLESAGYKYRVRVEDSGGSFRMILEHEDSTGHVGSAASHLSFGERNAFAMVLFLHQVRHENPDLVVLDDPVSSFDKTKKFAILHQLFHGKESLRDFTSLLLTHDIEPAIDIVRTSTSQQFRAAGPVAHFLQNKGGTLTEKLITRSDIMTFSQVCDVNIATAADPVIKGIYLRRRYEVYGELGPEYHLLSSLFHLRDQPCRKGLDGALIDMTPSEISAASSLVEKNIPGFDYNKLLAELRDRTVLRKKFEESTGGYEKVQLFRIATELDGSILGDDAAFRKFINETYHIENEYVMQLNPRTFDAVPEHIVATCERQLSSAPGSTAVLIDGI